MLRLSAMSAAALLTGIAYAPEGLAGSTTVEGGPNVTTFFIHKEEHEGVIELDLNGRILTALNERPEWAHGLAVALIAERVTFYEGRLGTMSKDHLAQNTISMDDLVWIGFDNEGDEVEVEASSEYRMNIQATTLGIDGEGELHGAIAENYIAEDTTWEQEAHQEQVANAQDQDQAANG